MRTRGRRIAVVTATAVAVLLAAVAVVVVVDGGRLRLPVAHTERFDATGITLPALATDGPRVVTEAGDVVVLRGLMAPDPAVLWRERSLDRDLVADMAATGANVVRVPVHPEHWSADEDYLWRHLDPIVRWAGEEGMYVILDWHSIGNVVTGAAPLMPELYAHDAELTRAFWAEVARYFADAPHVLLEVFNEPQGISADDWHRAATDLVGVIRAQGAAQPVIVGGLDYGRDLSWVLETPIADDAVVYASHVYPGHPRSGWDTWFGDVAAAYPVVMTEWGFVDEAERPGDAYLVGDADGYGRPLLDRLDALGAGWVACWWDDGWAPAMFADAALESPTTYGAFVLDALAAAPG